MKHPDRFWRAASRRSRGTVSGLVYWWTRRAGASC